MSDFLLHLRFRQPGDIHNTDFRNRDFARLGNDKIICISHPFLKQLENGNTHHISGRKCIIILENHDVYRFGVLSPRPFRRFFICHSQRVQYYVNGRHRPKSTNLRRVEKLITATAAQNTKNHADQACDMKRRLLRLKNEHRLSTSSHLKFAQQ